MSPPARRLASTLLIALLAWAPRASSADEHARDAGAGVTQDVVAWFADTGAALRLADQIGRPLWVVIHALPKEGAATWPHDLPGWQRVYRDPGVVAASQAFVCAQRLKWLPTDAQLAESPLHVVLGPDGRVLHQRAGWNEPAGAPTIEALKAFLGEGLRRFGPVPGDAPVVDPERVASATSLLAKREPAKVSAKGAGVRVRLRWDLPTPLWEGRDDQPLHAKVQMRWDGEGPFPLGRVRLPGGRPLDLPIEVRFDEIEGLRPLITEGKHRLDLELLPMAGSLPLGDASIPVGTAWIEVGDGGGGGGGGGESEQEEPPSAEPPPPPPPDEPPEPPPPPPPPEDTRIEVVEPFADDDQTVRKEDALVAVPDPTAGAKAPPPVPLEHALPELTRALEAAIADERVGPRERAFLRRYLEALAGRMEAGR